MTARSIALLFTVCGLLAAERPGANLAVNSAFDTDEKGLPAGWTQWSPRPELAVESSVVEPDGQRTLRMEAPRYSSYGKWISAVRDVRGGRTYRFEIHYRPEKIENEQVSVIALLSWFRDLDRTQLLQRDYAVRTAAGDGWRKFARTLKAPESAAAATIELTLRWAGGGAVSWRGPQFRETAPIPPRIPRIVTTRVRTHGKTVEENREAMRNILDQAAREKPDLVLLTETFTYWGTGKPPAEIAEPIPGPTTEILSRKAREMGSWAVVSLFERDGDEIHNTAVVVDRQGGIAGKFRKIHLPLSEAEDGVTPAAEYPVFDTDFGRVGVLICYDNWFPETARILRLRGAELLLLPVAGDGDPRHWDVITRARAIDNGIYLVTSNAVGDSLSRIVDPMGEVIAEVAAKVGVAAADLNLDRDDRVHWLSIGPGGGEPRSLFIEERRPDAYGGLTSGSPFE